MQAAKPNPPPPEGSSNASQPNLSFQPTRPPMNQNPSATTSGLLDRTGDRPRPPGVGNGTMTGAVAGAPAAVGMNNAAGPMRPMNRPNSITIPSAFPSIPTSGAAGTSYQQPPHSAQNTPVPSNSAAPTSATGLGGSYAYSNTSLNPSNNPYLRQQYMQPNHRMIGQNDRSVIGQGRLFTDHLARERARVQAEKAGLRNMNEPRSLVIADHAVEAAVKEIIRTAGRIKDHRVTSTNPRAPPFYPSPNDGAKKEEDGMDLDDERVPMWKVEILDNPGKEILAAHDAIEESEKLKKSARVRERTEYDERKKAEAEGRVYPAGPVPGADVPMADTSAVGSPAASASSPAAMVAPDNLGDTPVGKKPKPTKRNPQLDQDIQAKRLVEAQKQESNRALNKLMGGSKKYSWMSGGGGLGTPGPKTPLGKGLGVGGLGSGAKHKRASMQNGKIRINSPAMTPGTPSTPGPAGLRGNKRMLDGTPLGDRKRARLGDSVGPDTAAEKAIPYQFAQVEDRMTMNDLLSAFNREIRKGGPNRRILEKKYQELLVKAAESAAEEYKKENAGLGGSTIAGTASAMGEL